MIEENESVIKLNNEKYSKIPRDYKLKIVVLFISFMTIFPIIIPLLFPFLPIYFGIIVGLLMLPLLALMYFNGPIFPLWVHLKNNKVEVVTTKGKKYVYFYEGYLKFIDARFVDKETKTPPFTLLHIGKSYWVSTQIALERKNAEKCMIFLRESNVNFEYDQFSLPR
ncbi:MAG: hypothetical protein KKD98_05685 [Candidatus Thermoplasmatota archaeon]|nr:hypothetical protein [Candidatus Thermoplasmatota archaeon]